MAETGSGAICTAEKAILSGSEIGSTERVEVIGPSAAAPLSTVWAQMPLSRAARIVAIPAALD